LLIPFISSNGVVVGFIQNFRKKALPQRHRDKKKRKTRRKGDKEKGRKTSCLLVPPSPCLPLSVSVSPWLCGNAFLHMLAGLI
jgi:hypothetical protein